MTRRGVQQLKTQLYCSARDCRHLGGGSLNATNCYSCRAFPRGIPSDILTGKVQHTKVLPGQVSDYVLKPGPNDSLPGPI